MPANTSSAGPARPESFRLLTLDPDLLAALAAAARVPPISYAAPRADEAELGALGLFLLDTLGLALDVVPVRRLEDARRLLHLLSRLPTYRPEAAPDPDDSRWERLGRLADDQLEDVLTRARVAKALL